MLYEWLLIIHILAIISWMAGLLYLPRLFIYHIQYNNTQNASDAQSNIFCTMERRLLKFIMNPAMFVAFASGLYIAVEMEYFKQGWFHAKLTLVIFMLFAHMMMGRYRRQLEEGTCQKSEKFFKIFNEVPTLLMIGIVILVILKPF